MRAGHRYMAACAAARAGTAQGKDKPPADAVARAGLRKQALDGCAELGTVSRQMGGGPAGRVYVRRTSRRWHATRTSLPCGTPAP